MYAKLNAWLKAVKDNMQTILSKLPDSKAKKEVKQFAILSLAVSAVSLIVFWWLAIPGLAFGGRALLLTYHKGNQDRKDLTRFRIISILAIVFSIGSIAWFSLSS